MKILIFILSIIGTVEMLELKKTSTCQTALGMQSGAIPDSAISASSSYDVNTVGPKASRARTEQFGGAWCPLNQVTSLPNEWLEIEFDNLIYITQVETQGRFDNGRGKEYADQYILMYTRSSDKKLDEKTWIQYKLREHFSNASWIPANQNTYMGEIRSLDPPIVAKRLRFYPVSKKPRTVCMRVEVYGCIFSDGIVSYSMPQGRTDIYSFGDDTYDGSLMPENNTLMNGLGQLSDGITGSEDISLINGRQPWIGWSNESNSHISILFEFDTIRQINRMTIHTSNLFSKDIFIFKTAIISFALEKDEPNYSNAIIYHHHRDDIFEIARPILIELNQNIARFVRVDLYFDSNWILISEVTFDSQMFTEKSTDRKVIPEKSLPKIVNMAIDPRKRNRQVTTSTSTIVPKTTTFISPVLTIELSLAFVIGASLAVGLLLIGSLIWIVKQKKKLKFQKLTENPCKNLSRYGYPTLPVREFYDLNAPVISASDDREYAVPDLNFYTTFSPKHPFSTPLSLRASTTHSTSINSYPTLKSIPPCCGHASSEQYFPLLPESSYPFTQTQDASAIESVCGNSLMMRLATEINTHSSSIQQIDANELRVMDKIGQGSFGSIHLAERIIIGHDGTHPKTQLVIVKKLNDEVSDQQKLLFTNEIELLACLNDDSVCRLIGVANQQRTVAIFEYYSLDLYRYLREQSIPLDNSSASSFLLSFACQLASAMKYLSSERIVHRDLAARNCLISPENNQLRLTDVAMVKPDYANDYARVGRFQSRIAIRWAAWESIFLNQFSLKSDVWSFAVTLYEVYTYARQRPYHMLTNEQLVRQLASCNPMQSPIFPIANAFPLPQPELCSKEIYDMMCECWQRDAQRRPTFADIHTFLVSRAAGSLTLIPIKL